MREKIYICSPCRGENYDDNIENAITWSAQVFRLGFLPVTPHIYFTRFLSDENSEERAAALEIGRELLQECSEVWVFGALDNPSEGMKAEIAQAIRCGIPVRDGQAEVMKRTKEIRIRKDIPEDELKKLVEAMKHGTIMPVKPEKEPKHIIVVEVRRITGGGR